MCFFLRAYDNLERGYERLLGPIRVVIATAAIRVHWPSQGTEALSAFMSMSPDKQTSLPLMKRVQRDPADPARRLVTLMAACTPRFSDFSIPVAAPAFRAVDAQLGGRHRRQTPTI